MPEVKGLDKLLSFQPRGRVGKPRFYGRAIYGNSEYGAGDICLFLTEYGSSIYGVSPYGNLIQLSGIYQRVGAYGKFKLWLKDYLTTKNPRTEPQQTNRAKITSGVLAWQALTAEQKAVYNQKALGKHMSGYNVFLKEFLSS